MTKKANKKFTKLCEFLEDGTYSKDLFNERKYKLDIELKKLNDRKRKLSSNDRTKKYHKIKSMIPLIENVLKRYNNNITVEEKNELLGSIIEKVLYKKDKAGDDFSLKIFLKF